MALNMRGQLCGALKEKEVKHSILLTEKILSAP